MTRFVGIHMQRVHEFDEIVRGGNTLLVTILIWVNEALHVFQEPFCHEAFRYFCEVISERYRS